MKKSIIPMLGILAVALTSCGKNSNVDNNTNDNNSSNNSNTNSSISSEISFTKEASNALDDKKDITAAFSITTDDGSYSNVSDVVTITKGGSYVLSGFLNGQIVIDASSDEVELVLNNCKISYGSNSPIFVKSADEVKIKSNESTYNEINDTRSEKVEDSDTLGNGAIYAKCDLKLTGKGSLVVNASYNNGIHTTKDLSVKNTKLRCEAINNALKGNDSVTIESGNLILISSKGDGIKTEDSDISSKGNQRGTISINGGNIDIYSCSDGIDASYNCVVLDGSVINIHTNKYSTYSDTEYMNSYVDESSTTPTNQRPGGPSRFGGGPGGFSEGNSDKASMSAKGIKADNEIVISGGEITILAHDDGIHSNNDNELENTETPLGNVTISGGTLNISSSDDGIHADQDLLIKNGTINIYKSYEGIEGNLIDISGGTIYVNASDDGVNASSGNNDPLVKVSGGYLDVTVPQGDTDGIDSNGDYEQTGGFVITKNATNDTSGNMAALDIDGSCTITGGTFISVGPFSHTPTSASQNWVIFAQTSQKFNRGGVGLDFSQGTYSIDGTSISFTLNTDYKGLWISSSEFKTGTTYKLNGPSSYSFIQESGKTVVSS